MNDLPVEPTEPTETTEPTEPTGPTGTTRPAVLPEPVLAYLDARDEGRLADAAALFAPDAVVVDDGRTYTGAEEVGRWVARTSTEYSYTSTRLAAEVLDPTHAVVHVRLDGDFPGGTVTLSYDVEHRDGLLTRLTIGA